MINPHFICPASGETQPITTTRLVSEAGQPYDLAGLPAFDASRIVLTNHTIWRYGPFIAPADIQPVTLGEGWTPLIRLPGEQERVFLKLEGLNPTGSFKDRGASVLVSVLAAEGARGVHDDSSGNAGAALAAYSAAAGLNARLYVPAYASPAKLNQISLYGAALHPVEGPRSAATQAAVAEQETAYASHAHHPFIIAANRTIAYEIWEQLGRNAPDVVVMPVGHGTQLLGVARGFNALRDAGLIERVPRLIGVQAEACAPLYARLHGESGAGEGQTLAEGIRIINPVRGDAVVRAAVDSGGTIITVSEDAIVSGLRALAQRGIFGEPTCAVVWPAYEALRPTLSPGSTVILSITGNGLKTPDLHTFM
ncbi:MAG: pyridoxal-phosphate dependent enzyme [Chloroflexi bacterium]|nr:pyridoxal-phosphate dependent enzyme [Chloroflexota bacterium]